MNGKKARQIRQAVLQRGKQIDPQMRVGAEYTDRNKQGVIVMKPSIRKAYQKTKRKLRGVYHG